MPYLLFYSRQFSFVATPVVQTLREISVALRSSVPSPKQKKSPSLHLDISKGTRFSTTGHLPTSRQPTHSNICFLIPYNRLFMQA